MPLSLEYNFSQLTVLVVTTFTSKLKNNFLWGISCWISGGSSPWIMLSQVWEHTFVLVECHKEGTVVSTGCPPLCETQRSPWAGSYEQSPALQSAPWSLPTAFLVTPSTAAISQGCSQELPEHSAPPWISLALGFPPHTWTQCSGTGGAPATAASVTEYLHCQPDFKYCTRFLVTLSAQFDLLCIKGHLMGGGSFFLLLYLGMVNADARSGDEC